MLIVQQTCLQLVRDSRPHLFCHAGPILNKIFSNHVPLLPPFPSSPSFVPCFLQQSPLSSFPSLPFPLIPFPSFTSRGPGERLSSPKGSRQCPAIKRCLVHFDVKMLLVTVVNAVLPHEHDSNAYNVSYCSQELTR